MEVIAQTKILFCFDAIAGIHGVGRISGVIFMSFCCIHKEFVVFMLYSRRLLLRPQKFSTTRCKTDSRPLQSSKAFILRGWTSFPRRLEQCRLLLFSPKVERCLTSGGIDQWSSTMLRWQRVGKGSCAELTVCIRWIKDAGNIHETSFAKWR